MVMQRFYRMEAKAAVRTRRACDHAPAMPPAETASRLAGFERRGAGTDSERRAADWLVHELAGTGRDARLEPFWCRPNWALAHSWHVGLALGGSLLTVSSPSLGGALLLIALVSVIADELVGISPGRRLTPERASQNVVAAAPPRPDASSPAPRLIVTANYDAGRTGLAFRDPIRAAAARLRWATGGITPGWLGWIALAILWLIAVAIVRLEGHRSSVVGAFQLAPTVGLVLTLALLLELATADWSPAAGDNATGVAAAMALVRALDAAPPPRLAVELVLLGASDRGGHGLRAYLRGQGRTSSITLGIAAAGAGNVRWWESDGSLIPLRYSASARRLAAGIARAEPHLGATAHRGRGATPSYLARIARLPAIVIGCLDERGLAPRSHQATDTAAQIDPVAFDAAVQFGLMLVDAIDEN
jgi:hypothetical protein